MGGEEGGEAVGYVKADLCVEVEVDGFAVVLYLVYGDEVVGELHKCQVINFVWSTKITFIIRILATVSISST